MSLEGANLIPVVIASTLKPLEDVRAFQKLALSLGETNKYSLNIIGFSSEKPDRYPKIRFFSSMSHFHSKWDRWMAQFRFAKILIQVRPKLLICCTYEYLPLSAFFKLFFTFKLVYDVQENYRKNLDLNPSLPFWKKKLANYLIQKAEQVQGIDLFLLAESSYISEMPEKKPFLVLENKYQGEIRKVSQLRLDPFKKLKFCITGTLTPAYGTLEGLIWFQKLLEVYPHFELEVIGHCPIKEYKIQLVQQARNCSQVHLEISDFPILYRKIEKVLNCSDVSLLPYAIHPVIQDKLPTKLFECAALGIPILMTPNPNWENFYNSFKGGFSVDFQQTQLAVATFQQALSQNYFSTPVPRSVLWKTERLHFQEAIQNLLS
ncbi:hypothetical protein [Algoriphagus sp. AK58]|uniref:hypothetical protein n=1 Tax=Algoriphagus sp. AK58 TaxID=1406877 RepID=UPI001650A17C|nr:hypothetical protein [Algoriphagus sp. AK58]MBC6368043.1 hypothetical protein [Algoriphagus sp. AK58]